MTTLPTDALEVPRFCGTPTFMRLPQPETLDGLDVGIIGLPSDNGAPYRTGARFGPSAVRAMSVMLRPVNPYHGNINVFETLKVGDVGDAPVVPGYMLESLESMEGALAGLVDRGVVPAGIGGDHGVAIAELRALGRRHGPLALVQFDSHTDTWDRYFGGTRHSAGTPFRRGIEEGLIVPERSIQIGMRGSLFRETDLSQSLDLGYEVVTTDELFEAGLDTVGERVRRRVGAHPVFLSFDMDFVDPASAPGVGTPEAGGPNQRETLKVVRSLTGLDIVGCDVVETNPSFDGPGQVTALLAATVLAEILALIALARTGK
jgi:agmatinase